MATATGNDIEEDMWQLALARGCMCKLQGIEKFRQLSPLDVMTSAEISNTRQYICTYNRRSISKCAWPDLVCHVGDSAAGWCSWTGSSGILPTIRRSGGLYVIPSLNRYLTLKELYSAMGFPALEKCSRVCGMKPFPILFSDEPRYTWLDARRALGNAMHPAQVGTFTASLLLTSKPLE